MVSEHTPGEVVAVLFVVAVALFCVLIYHDYRRICFGAMAQKYVDANWSSKHSIWSLRRGVVPPEFAGDEIWYNRLINSLKQKHSIIILCTPTVDEIGSIYDKFRSFEMLSIVTRFGTFYLGAAFLANYYDVMEHTCSHILTESRCNSEVDTLYIKPNACTWVVDECKHIKDLDRSYRTVINGALVVCIFGSLLSIATKHLLKMVRCLYIKATRDIRRKFARTVQSGFKHGSMLNSFHDFAPRIIHAARLEKMKRGLDRVSVQQEIAWMLECEKRLKILAKGGRIPRNLSTKVEDFLAGKDIEATSKCDDILSLMRSLFIYEQVISESITNQHSMGHGRSVTTMTNSRHSGSHSSFQSENYMFWLKHRVKEARAHADDIALIMREFPDDYYREVYLMRIFFVDSLVGFRRAIAKRFFQAEDLFGVKSGFASDPRYQILCAVVLGLFIIYSYLYPLIMVDFKEDQHNLFISLAFIAFIQSILLIESMRILMYDVVLSSFIYDDVSLLCERVINRAKLIVCRTFGQMTPEVCYVQHVNSACRAARMFPHTAVGRLLSALVDIDMPESYKPHYFRQESFAKKSLRILEAFFMSIFCILLPEPFQDFLVETFVISVITVVHYGFFSFMFTFHYVAVFMASIFLILMCMLLITQVAHHIRDDLLVGNIFSYFCFSRSRGANEGQYELSRNQSVDIENNPSIADDPTDVFQLDAELTVTPQKLPRQPTIMSNGGGSMHINSAFTSGSSSVQIPKSNRTSAYVENLLDARGAKKYLGDTVIELRTEDDFRDIYTVKLSIDDAEECL
jgi:hypothetical protein